MEGGVNWTKDTPSLNESNANETVADRGTISSELEKRRLFPGTPPDIQRQRNIIAPLTSQQTSVSETDEPLIAVNPGF